MDTANAIETLETAETAEEQIEALQTLINSGTVWRIEGFYGRLAMDAIQSGLCALGEEAHRDYWGNRVPSRHEIVPGDVGSIEYVERMSAERD